MKLAIAGAVWVAMAIAVVVLASGLPADTFFVGDPGVKLIVARHAIAHLLSAPGNPPASHRRRAGSLRGAVFCRPRRSCARDYLRSLPARERTLHRIFRPSRRVRHTGNRLPHGHRRLRVARHGSRRSPESGRDHFDCCVGHTVSVLRTGVLEHAPAVGMAACATALFVRHHATFAFPSGILLGIAALLRPEALWWAVALLASARLLATPPRPRAMIAATAGFAIAWLPELAYTFAHFGTILAPHVTVNLAGSSDQWTPERLLRRWFIDMSPANFWRVAPVVLLIFVPVARTERRGRWFLRVAALLSTALVILTAPNDGGGQWGPRYLLFAYLPLTVLVADAIEVIARPKVFGPLAVSLIFIGSAWIQRTAYEELRGAKLAYGRVLAMVRDEVPVGASAVTDLVVAGSGCCSHHR